MRASGRPEAEVEVAAEVQVEVALDVASAAALGPIRGAQSESLIGPAMFGLANAFLAERRDSPETETLARVGLRRVALQLATFASRRIKLSAC